MQDEIMNSQYLPYRTMETQRNYQTQTSAGNLSVHILLPCGKGAEFGYFIEDYAP